MGPFVDAHPLIVQAAQEIAQTGALPALVFDAYRPGVRQFERALEIDPTFAGSRVKLAGLAE